MASICARVACTGWVKTTQLTPSVQGGVVSEPFRRRCGSRRGSSTRVPMGLSSTSRCPSASGWRVSAASDGLECPGLNTVASTARAPSSASYTSCASSG